MNGNGNASAIGFLRSFGRIDVLVCVTFLWRSFMCLRRHRFGFYEV